VVVVRCPSYIDDTIQGGTKEKNNKKKLKIKKEEERRRREVVRTFILERLK
jgi:hypothetical protein